MSRDNKPWSPAGGAGLAYDENGTPRSDTFDDVYYSRESGSKESRYVFLEGNDLPARFAQQDDNRPFCIGETGFGTGLNFLLTWQAWRQAPEPRRPLHFISFEKHPLSATELEIALSHWPKLAEHTAALLANYPPPVPGAHRLLLDGGRVRLDLWFDDAGQSLADLASLGQRHIDAWYLDGFAPARNREMWGAELLACVGQLSRPGATFSTFTAVGQVKRDLQAAGFAVSKRAGFGTKRECLRGDLQENTPAVAPSHTQTPWDLSDSRPRQVQDALVVGGGLAGCFTAAALAARGVNVTLLEADRIASGASGNDQGVLFTRLSHRHSTLVDFALLSYLHATARYRAMFDSGALAVGRDGELCGCLQQVGDAGELERLTTALDGAAELARVIHSHIEASELTGAEQALPGIWLPGSGWLRPPAVCQALVDHPLITVREHCGELALEHRGGRWHAGALAHADCAVITCGTKSTAFPSAAWLPLRTIRGQTSHVPASALPGRLRAALCHSGYIAPAQGEEYCLGATFAVDDHDMGLRLEDHAHNLNALADAMPVWKEAIAAIDPATLEGRVGFRAATPDYLPLVGPCPDLGLFTQRYVSLKKDARAVIEEPGAYLPGLYINAGHGSRGLSSTPLAGELIASQVLGETPPFERRLARALSPARFIIRDLSRNRI